MSQLSNFTAFVEELPSGADIWKAVVSEYVENGDGDGKLSKLLDGREVIFWEDGAGNEAHFIHPALPGGSQGSIIVRIYDHESEFNAYGLGDEVTQPALEGIPSELEATVEDPDIFWFSWDEDTKTAYATAFLWNIDGVWEYTDSFRQALEEADDDGGARYVLNPIVEAS